MLSLFPAARLRTFPSSLSSPLLSLDDHSHNQLLSPSSTTPSSSPSVPIVRGRLPLSPSHSPFLPRASLVLCPTVQPSLSRPQEPSRLPLSLHSYPDSPTPTCREVSTSAFKPTRVSGGGGGRAGHISWQRAREDMRLTTTPPHSNYTLSATRLTRTQNRSTPLSSSSYQLSR